MDLLKISLAQLADKVKENEISPREIWSFFQKRIVDLNKKLNVYLTVQEEMLLNDDKKDQLFYGIPFSMKDTYSTKGIRTTAGSKVLNKHTPSFNATVYERLLTSGAMLMGKSNCDAWGHGSSTENSDFGVTKNPWNQDYVAGGSSGGSAAAVAAGFSMFDIGEDTGGSIRMPSSFCSVVGLKPTYGLISRYGCIAYASSLDTVGPITRSVEDCAFVLQVVAGYDGLDATTNQRKTEHYSKTLQDSIKGKKIGIPKEYSSEGTSQEVALQLDKAVDMFKELGCEIVSISLPMTKYAIATYYLIAPSETSSNLGRYDGIRYGNDRSAFGAEAKRRIILGTFTLSAGYYDAYYKRATKVRTLIKQDFETAFEHVDVILAPTSPTPPFKIGEKVENPLQMYLSDIFAVPVNLAGIPSLAVPCGFTSDNLPVGIQLIGKHFSEAELLNVGYQFEKVRGQLPSPPL